MSAEPPIRVSEAMFDRISHRRSAEEVIEQICRRIEEGALRAGDRLPSERELARQFGVSRTCVREALRILEVMGTVQVQPGKGIFVLDSINLSGGVSIWLPWARAHTGEILELLDVREALDAKSVFLASKRAGELDFRELDRIMYQAAEAVERVPVDVDEFVALDIRFHQAMAKLSGSRILASVTRLLTNSLNIDRRASFSIADRPRRSVEEHREILDAVKRGDGVAASRAVCRHVENVKAALASLCGSGVCEDSAQRRAIDGEQP